MRNLNDEGRDKLRELVVKYGLHGVATEIEKIRQDLITLSILKELKNRESSTTNA